MYRYFSTLPTPPRVARISAPFSRLDTKKEYLGNRRGMGKTTFLSNPSQVADPDLRGGDGLFPNLRVGKFGREALADDLSAYRVPKMFRPDVINLKESNPRLAKAREDIQFQKAGQSPGQALALAELIRKDPELAKSFNMTFGSTLNRTQGELQKAGKPFEFDPNDGQWKSGFSRGSSFKRENPDIVQMDALQDSLLTSTANLTTLDGRPLDPSNTKLYYNSVDRFNDVNDPQKFFNLKGRSDVDYGRIASALDGLPLDTRLNPDKKDYSLAKRWARVQDYSPFPPSGATYVTNADKPYQTVNEVMADVNQIEVSRSPRIADSRIARSQNLGNSDNNNIPKDFTRKEYLEATGDSDNLPPVLSKEDATLIRTSDGWEYLDRNGNPVATSDVARAMKNPSTVIEDRDFLLSQPQAQRSTTRLGKQTIGDNYFNPYTQDYARGTTNLSDNLSLQNFSQPNSIAPARMAWNEGGLSSITPTKEQYLRIPEKRYVVNSRDGSPLKGSAENDSIYTKEFYSPETIFPASMTSKTQQYSGNMGYSPNTYRKATLDGKDVNNLDITQLSRREAKQLKDVGFYEFNDIMDEGVRTSKDIDRLYGVNDELAYLSDIAQKDDMYSGILGYEQSNVMDKIVEAERKQQDMGGTYRALTGKNDQGAFEQERMAFEGRPSALTQYNVDKVLEPSFGRDYSGRTNTGRTRVSVGTEYDAGIPIGADVKTRIANPIIDPIQLDSPELEPFNQAQYTRDLIDRGGTLIDTQLGIPIVKAPTTSYDSGLRSNNTLTNIGGAIISTPKNISYAQSVRPSQANLTVPWGSTPDSSANWQAPSSMAIGRVGQQMAIEGIPELPTGTGTRMSSPQVLGDIYGPTTPMSRAALPSRQAQQSQGQVLYPNAGIGPLNTGLRPKPFLSELFGFSAISPEGLAKYRDMG
jgi:hypothetical protein